MRNLKNYSFRSAKVSVINLHVINIRAQFELFCRESRSEKQQLAKSAKNKSMLLHAYILKWGYNRLAKRYCFQFVCVGKTDSSIASINWHCLNVKPKRGKLISNMFLVVLFFAVSVLYIYTGLKYFLR